MHADKLLLSVESHVESCHSVAPVYAPLHARNEKKKGAPTFGSSKDQGEDIMAIICSGKSKIGCSDQITS